MLANIVNIMLLMAMLERRPLLDKDKYNEEKNGIC